MIEPETKVTVERRGQNRPHRHQSAADVSLFGTEDFAEGRKAQAENRSPIFHGR